MSNGSLILQYGQMGDRNPLCFTCQLPLARDLTLGSVTGYSHQTSHYCSNDTVSYFGILTAVQLGMHERCQGFISYFGISKTVGYFGKIRLGFNIDFGKSPFQIIYVVTDTSEVLNQAKIESHIIDIEIDLR